MRVLYVTYGAPWEADRGARVRDSELIRRVAGHHEVTVLAVAERDGQCPAGALGPVAHAETVGLGPGARRLGAVATGRLPVAALPFLSARVLGRVRELAGGGAFDLVQVEHSVLAPCLDAVPGGVRSVLSLHNVGATQYASMARGAGSRADRAGYRMKSAALRRLERRRAPRFDRVTVVSADDGAALAAIASGVDAVVVPNGVDVRRAQPLPEPESGAVLAFVGNLGYAPNAQAARELAAVVLPRVREQVPDAEAWIAGPDAPAAVLELGSLPGVRLLGRVPDVADVHRAARVVVVPLASGGGTRLKVLEAMAHQRCVVSTPLGCAGLAVADGREVLLADGSAALADATVRALTDATLRRAVAARGRAFVEREHDWDRSAGRLLDLYAELAA